VAPKKTSRRRFSNVEKLRILKEADACSKPGEIGALLRREGLYSSAIANWRQQRREGLFSGTAPRLSARDKSAERQKLLKQMAELERENRRLERKLKQAEIIMDAQKKIAEILQLNDLSEGSN
jgi:transposase